MMKKWKLISFERRKHEREAVRNGLFTNCGQCPRRDVKFGGRGAFAATLALCLALSLLVTGCGKKKSAAAPSETEGGQAVQQSQAPQETEKERDGGTQYPDDCILYFEGDSGFARLKSDMEAGDVPLTCKVLYDEMGTRPDVMVTDPDQIREIYNRLAQVTVGEKSNLSVTDSYHFVSFHLRNDTYVACSFEGENLLCWGDDHYAVQGTSPLWSYVRMIQDDAMAKSAEGAEAAEADTEARDSASGSAKSGTSVSKETKKNTGNGTGTENDGTGDSYFQRVTSEERPRSGVITEEEFFSMGVRDDEDDEDDNDVEKASKEKITRADDEDDGDDEEKASKDKITRVGDEENDNDGGDSGEKASKDKITRVGNEENDGDGGDSGEKASKDKITRVGNEENDGDGDDSGEKASKEEITRADDEEDSDEEDTASDTMTHIGDGGDTGEEKFSSESTVSAGNEDGSDSGEEEATAATTVPAGEEGGDEDGSDEGEEEASAATTSPAGEDGAQEPETPIEQAYTKVVRAYAAALAQDGEDFPDDSGDVTDGGEEEDDDNSGNDSSAAAGKMDPIVNAELVREHFRAPNDNRVYYGLRDLNGDGVQELVIALGSEEYKKTWTAYTFDGIEAVELFKGRFSLGYRTTLFLLDGGSFLIHASGGASAGMETICRINAAKNGLELIAEYEFDEQKNGNMDHISTLGADSSGNGRTAETASPSEDGAGTEVLPPRMTNEEFDERFRKKAASPEGGISFREVDENAAVHISGPGEGAQSGQD